MFTFLGSCVNWLAWLLQGGWDNLSWQVQVVSQVLDTFVGQVPVVMLPSKSLGDIASRGERLKSLDDVQVWNGNLWVILWVEVFLGNNNALCE